MKNITKSQLNSKNQRFNLTYRNKAINRLRKLYENTGDPLTLESINILVQDGIDAKERNKSKRKNPKKKKNIVSKKTELEKLGAFAYHASKRGKIK